MEGSDDCVKVAVSIRPLIASELLNGFPHISSISAFHGFNLTASGKTYTMGTNYSGEANASGIIPRIIEKIFDKVNKLKDNTEFFIRVSFIEIFKEKVYDLLDQQIQTARPEICKMLTAGSGPNRVPIQIRETAPGGITLAGVRKPAVKSKEEMASFLAQGSLNRATASTRMNSQSSRSHAIFTIYIEQKRAGSSSQNNTRDDTLISKLHLVDLAGSESAKLTGADGLRLKEGVHINKGLLALGNVIRALGDENKHKQGVFVPYRDSKLTRLLKDSLGGNSKTAKIACISPANSNVAETINILKYANRARNIKNKAVVNCDPVAYEMQRLRSQLEEMPAELHFVHSDGASLEEIQILQEKIYILETKNEELLHQLKETHRTCDDLVQKATTEAQILREKVSLLEMKYKELLRRLKEEISEDLGSVQDGSSNASSECEGEENMRLQQKEVEVQQKIQQESEQLWAWKASREKEVLQVLQRRTEEATMATKCLKELLEAEKASSHELANGPGIQALMQAVEHELEVTVRVHEVRLLYERQMQERAAMSKEIARLKEETDMLQRKIISDHPQTMSPSASSSRISALENMMAASSSILVLMASQLSEAEEREGFSSKGGWNHVRSLPETKNMMNFLFDLASSSRCQLIDLEAESREKDAQISELKAEVDRLTSADKELEVQNGELQVGNLQVSEVLSARNHEINSSKSMVSSSKLMVSMSPQTRENNKCFYIEAEWENDIVTSDSSDSDFIPSDTPDEESDWTTTIKKMCKKCRTMIVAPSRHILTGTASSPCCTCSKRSSCKTRKCECRFAGAECDISCSCSSDRCVNRGFNDTVSQATYLLRSAMKRGLEERDKSRKPLGDIGNVKAEQHGEKTMMCECSKRSFCKTNKCECRLAGAECGVSCRCLSAKCTNRRFKERSC